MKALLDTNIIIHREARRVINQEIGILFKWLDRAKYTKCIHPVTLAEIGRNPNKDTVDTFLRKIDSYEKIIFPAPLSKEVREASILFDKNENDRNDSQLLNEVYVGRVDILISEDNKIHEKAEYLSISHKVFKIETVLEKIASEHPDLIDYKVLSVRRTHFAEINLYDEFFDSFREDYPDFDNWFVRKADEKAYITTNNKNGRLLSFLYIKIEDETEDYSDIYPAFARRKRLKIGTFKVISNGFKLGERFLKIVFDNALVNRVDEIYLTIFDKRDEQKRLIGLVEQWGFRYWGQKGEEKVYVRDFTPHFAMGSLRQNYPYLSRNLKAFLVPIYEKYHTELLPDSILKTETPLDFIENFPHRNAISKVYVSRAMRPHPSRGDILIFYRTGGYHKSVVTTVGIVEEVIYNIKTEEEFITHCRKGSVFPEKALKEMWNFRKTNRPFLIRFLYVYSFPHRINMRRLIQLGILRGVEDAPRGFKPISTEQLNIILKETRTDESFVVD
jgi:predicted nucleic acid-binding protein